MRRKLALALSALIVAAVPAILIGNTLWVLMNPWFVHAQYAVPGFPADSHGLGDHERTDLAVTGIRSIRPASDGVELLREARLPSGSPAFEEREIQHMGDVRGLVAGFLTVWAIAVVLAVAAALGLRRLGAPGSVWRALVAGAFLTVAAMALVGLIMLINFGFFFDGIHGVFFEGDSWRFNSSYILRQLYPDFFWGVAGGTMAAVVVLQAVALVAGLRERGRDDRRLGNATPVDAREAGSPIHEG
jgi:integral membrane protein (TIGR01906 family)